MKPAPFILETPPDLVTAARLLTETSGARAIAGGQSLGPMLNLRVARPPVLVRVAALPELRGAAETATHVIIGAAVTHAEIADGRVPDIGQGILARIAEGIAYRAVRNQGTIGGSLCHADPAADWVCTLTALGADLLTFRAAGARTVAMSGLMKGAFRTCLEPGEILRAIRIPKLSTSARWGYFKACRKPGDFAHAMTAVLDDPARGIRRAAIGALGGAPLLLEGETVATPAAEARLGADESGLDAIDRHMQMVAFARALERVKARAAA